MSTVKLDGQKNLICVAKLDLPWCGKQSFISDRKRHDECCKHSYFSAAAKFDEYCKA